MAVQWGNSLYSSCIRHMRRFDCGVFPSACTVESRIMSVERKSTFRTIAVKGRRMDQAERQLQSQRIYFGFTLVFCCGLLVSNVLALKVFTIGPFTMPCSIVLYPVVYIINDVVSDVFGFHKMRRTILVAFTASALATMFYTIAIYLPGHSTESGVAFASVFMPSWRILVGSFASYLAGSILNSYVMVRLKKRFESNLFFRCVFSTAVGEAVDAIVFLTVAYAGTVDTSVLLTMIGSQWLFKVLYETIAYPATRQIILKTRATCA